MDALIEAGLAASASDAADVVIAGPAGAQPIEVKAMSFGDLARVQSLLQRDAEAAAGASRPADRLVVVVADQLTEEARDLLRRSGWGYLDRRGALWLRAAGMLVNDRSLPRLDRRRPRPTGPIRGRVGLGVALHLLMHPHAHDSVRGIAGILRASPSTVHDALASLREQALIDAGGVPLVPELFNITASLWRPERIPVRREPNPGDRDLELGLHDENTGDVAEQGWVVGGDVAAAALGAPVVVGSGAPPDFYVPTQALVRRALRRLGECTYDQRGATIAAAPSPAVTGENHYVGSHRAPWLHWPIAHPVVVALDLAQDLSRGREILDDWTPRGFDRVW